MLRISDFARLGNVSAKALRIYDEMGILKPHTVDRWTSYRYYTVDQLSDLNRILALRDLGFSLDQIRSLLHEGLPTTTLQEMLKAREVELSARLSAEQARLERIRARLHRLEQEKTMPQYEIVLKQIEPLPVASLRGVIPDLGGLEGQWHRLYDYLNPRGVPWSIPNLIVWRSPDNPEEGIDVEVAAPLPAGAQVDAGDGVTVYTLAGGTMAATVHHGGYDHIGEAYETLYRWVDENGYTLTGDTRQVHLPYADDESPDTYVTELQFPVARR
jgi:DNA-binding transcriptional MerR regulator